MLVLKLVNQNFDWRTDHGTRHEAFGDWVYSVVSVFNPNAKLEKESYLLKEKLIFLSNKIRYE